MSNVRPQVLGLVRRSDGDVLVQQLPGDDDGHFHRFVGGGIHPGERSADAVEREFREELDLAAAAGPTVCTLENLFTYGRAEHHELVVVRAVAFDDPAAYDRDRFHGVDGGGAVEYEAYWRSPAELRAADAPLYPAGIGDALAPVLDGENRSGTTTEFKADEGAAVPEGVGHFVSPDPRR